MVFGYGFDLIGNCLNTIMKKSGVLQCDRKEVFARSFKIKVLAPSTAA
jgi:hypothetical protein